MTMPWSLWFRLCVIRALSAATAFAVAAVAATYLGLSTVHTVRISKLDGFKPSSSGRLSLLALLVVMQRSVCYAFVTHGSLPRHSSNQPMQPTAGRRTVPLQFMKKSLVFFTRALASRG